MRVIAKPLWKQYGKTWEQFRDDGLVKAGTIVRVETALGTKTVLIGEINESNGSCSCCSYFDWTEIVIEYKIIAEDE